MLGNNIDWEQTNQRYLLKSIQRIKRALELKVSKSESFIDQEEPPESQEIIDPEFLPTIEQISLTFSLSSFERDILMFCAGMEIDPCFASLCAIAQGDEQKNYPTFSLAREIFSNAHWSAFLPSGPLRRWQLIEIGTDISLTLSPLKINERILHYLTGLDDLDEKLIDFVEPLDDSDFMVDSHQRIAQKLTQIYQMAGLNGRVPLIQLCGEGTLSKRAIAYSACQQIGLSLYLLNFYSLLSNSLELSQFLRIWRREFILSGGVLLLECDDDSLSDGKTSLINQLVEKVSSPLIINTRDRIIFPKRSLIKIDVHKPTSREQTQLWQKILSDSSIELNGYVEKLVGQFNLDALEIESACTSTFSYNEGLDIDQIKNSLWDECRIQARPRMESLAQRINPQAGWEDLILPAAQMETLRSIVAHVRQRTKVYETWGFAEKSDRGLGISALFSGASGTGKTTAAEVLAKELTPKLDGTI